MKGQGQPQVIRSGIIFSAFAFSFLLTILYASERIWPRCVLTHNSNSKNTNTESPVKETVEHRDDGTNDTLYFKRAGKPLPPCALRNGKDGQPLPAKSFLMVFMSRSGSTTISQTMHQHPKIHHEFELLDREKVPRDDGAAALNMTRQFFTKAIANGEIPGFKIRSYHILADVEGWRKLTEEFDTRIIWQYRKNVFKVAIGTYARLVLGDDSKAGGFAQTEVEGKNKCELGVGCSFRIDDWTELHKIITSRIEYDTDVMKATSVLDGGRQCIFELPYEDFLYHQKDTYSDLWRFLGIPPLKSYDTYTAKATDDSLCDVIENFDELCTNFYGCPIWQQYLDDFHNNCRCRNFISGVNTFCSMYNDQQLAYLKNAS